MSTFDQQSQFLLSHHSWYQCWLGDSIGSNPRKLFLHVHFQIFQYIKQSEMYIYKDAGHCCNYNRHDFYNFKNMNISVNELVVLFQQVTSSLW